MSKKNDKRLCWNCHGDVSYHLDQCPYCGVSIGAQQHSFERGSKIPPPPYGMGDEELFGAPEKKLSYGIREPEENPYELTQEEWNEALSAEEGGETQKELKQTRGVDSKQILPTASIFIGTLLFLLGLVILCFAKEDYFVLSWNKKTAFLYLGIGVPFCCLGFFKTAKKPR